MVAKWIGIFILLCLANVVLHAVWAGFIWFAATIFGNGGFF